jgi:AraC family transcriptional regulator
VRRLRLHRAAVELTRDDAPLGTVAKRAGYGTLAAFSRACAADYGVPPGAYRLRGKLLPPAPHRHREPVDKYEIEIAPFPGVRLAAIPHRGDYQEIGHAFERVFAWAGARNLIGPATRLIGIYYDDPKSVREEELRAEACVTIDAETMTDGDAHTLDVPPLVCASVLHKGPYAELEWPYCYLFREWLPRSGYEPADHPCMEEYLNNPRELHAPEWLTRIYLPIKE